jgi:radical SAM superfamily enzyme YgiQ (UPF0313 family)
MKENLNIKLIAPKMSLRPMDTEFKRRMSPSLSLVILATLTPPKHKVYIEDENIEPINFNDEPDLVGITINVDTTSRPIEIAYRYRKKGCKVIFGGIHASADADNLIQFCDSICIGEAEELWKTIINDIKNNTLKSRYYNEKTTDLKNYPSPQWDYIKSAKYLYSNIVITSRGCPFKCEFCYNSCDYVKSVYRNRPIENVLEDIEALNSKQIYFIDDNLIGNIRWFREFLIQLKEKRLIWHGAVSANISRHKDLIDLMADSGCRSLFIGFESINPTALLKANKTQNVITEYEELIHYLHDRSIMVNASLVFGFDSDDKNIFNTTLKWLIQNKVETMTAHILTPYPGTQFYKKLIREDRIIDYDLDKYNTSNVVFRPQNLTPQELRNGYLHMYKEFYSFRNIIKRRPDNIKLLLPYFLFNLGYRKFGGIFSLIGRLGFMSKIGKLGTRLSYNIE